MVKILLIIPDWTLRQLYHELLFSLDTEIVPAGSIDDAVMLLAIERFDKVVLYTDTDTLVNEIFLKLRKDRAGWRETMLVLLTSEKRQYQHLLEKNDIMLDPLLMSPQEIAEKVKTTL